MRFAYQTIVFGREIGAHHGGADAVFEFVARAGFTGIEIAQAPGRVCDSDGRPITRLVDLMAVAKRFGLSITGLSGGSLDDRVGGWLEARRQGLDALPFLYTDNWHDRYAAYLSEGVPIALHPHVFMHCDRLRIARELIEKHPALLWMPDTAHLAIVGDSIESALRWRPDRMPAVHFKDWDPAFGRSYHRYAKGFVPLGQGRIRLDEILKLLRSLRYDGYVTVEQDYADTDPFESVAQAARTMRVLCARANFPEGERFPESSVARAPQTWPAPTTELARTPLAARVLGADILGVRRCYIELADALREHFDAARVELWSYDPSRGYTCRLSASPDTFGDDPGAFALPDTLVGSAAENRETVHDGGCVAFPIFNRFNRHHVRFIACARNVKRFDRLPGIDDALSDLLARAADDALNDACTRAAGLVNFLADTSENLDTFLKDLAGSVRDAIDCEGATLFLSDVAGFKLEVAATVPGLRWRDDVPENQRYYLSSETASSTVRTWRRGQPQLMLDGIRGNYAGDPLGPKSREAGAGVRETRDNILLVPVVSVEARDSIAWKSRVVGVVRCRNRKGKGEREKGKGEEAIGTSYSPLFSVDDAAIVEAICQSAVPHLELLRAERERVKSVGRIVHELSSPVNTLRRALGSLTRDLDRIKERHGRDFRFDYVKDINAWLDLMNRVILSASVYGLVPGSFELRIRRAWVMAEIVAPVVAQVRFMLEARGFDPQSISYSSFAEIPKLYIDVNLFQQVFFNLISNSIKYALKDAKLFSVQIVTAMVGNEYVIRVRDFGPGIIPGLEKGIFEEGVRGPDSLNRVVFGLGIGLWVVRRVVEAHGGRVEVTNFYGPTEISVFLPVDLRDRAPRPTGDVARVVMEGQDHDILGARH